MDDVKADDSSTNFRKQSEINQLLSGLAFLLEELWKCVPCNEALPTMTIDDVFEHSVGISWKNAVSDPRLHDVGNSIENCFFVDEHGKSVLT